MHLLHAPDLAAPSTEHAALLESPFSSGDDAIPSPPRGSASTTLEAPANSIAQSPPPARDDAHTPPPASSVTDIPTHESDQEEENEGKCSVTAQADDE